MNNRICVFGEVLFDGFPDGKRVLGGAPFNIAWHLQGLGLAPLLISRVGSDPEGMYIQSAMDDWGLDRSSLQTDKDLPTGQVKVSFNRGEPQYDIVHPAAYDAIENPVVSGDCSLLYHGSLALRSGVSLAALDRLKKAHSSLVFLDVNLRPPWCDREQVLDWVLQADWVKLNGDELDWLSATGKAAGQETAAQESAESGHKAQDFLAKYELQALVLTHGARGAELITKAGDQFHTKPESRTKVVDTVGAGDAFSAVMIAGLTQDWTPEQTLWRAQQFASAVVGLRGATTDERAFYDVFLDSWSST